MTAHTPINIVGGGLSGLALGCALQKRGIQTQIHEAGDYPRHKVCGEFICGVNDTILQDLGIATCLDAAVPLTTVCFFSKGEPVFEYKLPSPARGISRFLLDETLATTYRTLGGTLHTQSPSGVQPEDGWIQAHGRIHKKEGLVGLKIHARDMSLRSDLEMHLGTQGYVGISPVDANTVNICGLFRKQRQIKGKEMLEKYLDANDLAYLKHKMLGKVEESRSIVTGVVFDRQAQRHSPGKPMLSLGDRFGMIPPFTGNGMSIAFESAAVCIPEIVRYAQSTLDWPSVIRAVNRKQANAFNRRLWIANRIHPMLFHPTGRQVLPLLLKACPPLFPLLYQLTRR